MRGERLSPGSRSSVVDRPWGVTLGVLGLEDRTATLTLHAADHKLYRVAFFRGAVVGATSPLAVDSVVRVALTGSFIVPAQVGELTRRVFSAPEQDEIKAVVEAASLSPEQGCDLSRRVILQRAARTFSIEQGELEVEDKITIPISLESEIDVRSVIYLGARMNLSADRLASDLRGFGSQFVLRPEALDELARFDFTEADQPILDALVIGTSLPELEATHRELDPRRAQAVMYALASCDAITVTPAMHATLARTPTLREPTVSRVPTPREPTISRVPTPREPTYSHLPAKSQARTISAPVVTRAMTEAFTEGRTTTIRPSPLTASEVLALIATRTAMLDQGTDHFSLLGIPIGAHVDAVRAAYVELARNLRPDRLAELGIEDPELEAQRLFAQVGIAFTVLTNAVRREQYLATLEARARPDKKAMARDAFRRGEVALRAEQPAKAVVELRTACELDPSDIDYFGMLGWATFCAAADKSIVAAEVRRALERAILKSPQPEVARFYLGRVERMLGRDDVAVRHFREVLQLQPGHPEASSELRVLESRFPRGTRPSHKS